MVGTIISGIAYDFLKKLFFLGVKYSAAKKNRWALKNAQLLVKHYQRERMSLMKIKEKDGEELLIILKSTFKSLFFGLTLLIGLSVINYSNNKLLFYSFLGASTLFIFQIVHELFYHYRLIQKAKKFEFHLTKIDKRIKYVQELIILKKQ